MILLPLISIPLIFLLVALFKPRRSRVWPCAICAAVSLTWLILLVLPLVGVATDPLAIAVLMGMSVTGAMFKLEAHYRASGLKHLWTARLVTIVGGFYAVILFLEGRTSLAIVIAVAAAIVLVLVSFLFQNVTHSEALAGVATDGQKKSDIKKLDNCC